MLGDRLTELRKSKGLTQRELAEIIHLSRDTYAQYEINRRRPDYETIKTLASFYQVPIDYLLEADTDEVYIENDIIEALQKGTYLDGKPISKEDRKKLDENLPFLIKMIKNTLKE